jgi:hypothetical protein
MHIARPYRRGHHCSPLHELGATEVQFAGIIPAPCRSDAFWHQAGNRTDDLGADVDWQILSHQRGATAKPVGIENSPTALRRDWCWRVCLEIDSDL